MIEQKRQRRSPLRGPIKASVQYSIRVLTFVKTGFPVITSSYPKRLIEVDLPIRRISAHARRE